MTCHPGRTSDETCQNGIDRLGGKHHKYLPYKYLWFIAPWHAVCYPIDGFTVSPIRRILTRQE